MATTAGIIDFALHPPVGSLAPNLDTGGPYPAGSHTLLNFSGSRPVADSYGVIVIATSIGVYYGKQVGYVSGDGQVDGYVWEGMLAQVVPQHQMVGGAWVATQTVPIVNGKQLVTWDEAFPGRLGLWVAPSVQVDLYYLLAL